jgi:hypothetical protein
MYTRYKSLWRKGFLWKMGLFFLGKGILEGRRKTKRKAPDLSDAVAIFCGI